MRDNFVKNRVVLTRVLDNVSRFSVRKHFGW
jgi:hypothetical protein